MDLPEFRYHPDPVATGAFERLTHTCRCCGQARDWVYSVTPYAEENLRDELCPWCIADGSAAARFDARFTVLADTDVPDGISPAMIEELTSRTPGFSAWDQERWLFHCGDACAFLGPAGWEELQEHPDVEQQLVDDAVWSGSSFDDAEILVGSLDVDGAATAYLFRCRHCGVHLAYFDTDAD